MAVIGYPAKPGGAIVRAFPGLEEAGQDAAVPVHEDQDGGRGLLGQQVADGPAAQVLRGPQQAEGEDGREIAEAFIGSVVGDVVRDANLPVGIAPEIREYRSHHPVDASGLVPDREEKTIFWGMHADRN